jgi:hypothetical protein
VFGLLRAALATRFRQLDTAQNAQILSLEQLHASSVGTAAGQFGQPGRQQIAAWTSAMLQ